MTNTCSSLLPCGSHTNIFEHFSNSIAIIYFSVSPHLQFVNFCKVTVRELSHRIKASHGGLHSVDRHVVYRELD